jgi:uncharacterized membrane protein YkvA (DUF1232 family)
MRTRSNTYKARRAVRKSMRWRRLARNSPANWYNYAHNKADRWRAIACKYLGMQP